MAVGTDLQYGDLDYADDWYADDHTDNTIELAADDDSKKDQQRVEVGHPGDKNRDQDKVVDQHLGDQDIENDNPPELPTGSEVNKGNQDSWNHADDRTDVRDQVGDTGEDTEHWRVTNISERKADGDDQSDNQCFENPAAHKVGELATDQIGEVANHLEVPVRGECHTAAQNLATVTQEKEGKERYDNHQPADFQCGLWSLCEGCRHQLFCPGANLARKVVGLYHGETVVQGGQDISHGFDNLRDITREVGPHIGPEFLPVRSQPENR